ncbi:MAG: transposase [Rubrobacter sp.]|nr:transposase [Rubrobacter sp.]
MPEVRRVILAMTGPIEEQDFRLGWSLWRRAHQAVAKRCHKAAHAAKHQPPRGRLLEPARPAPTTSTTTMPLSTRISAPLLTDKNWELVRALMPPQKPRTGRPRKDNRTVLAGMLWVFGSGGSWRDLPEEEFGPWPTVYGRYRKWREEGLWQRIVKVLQF